MNAAQIARFGAVGLAQNAINVAVFAALQAAGARYGVSAILAALTALLVSFGMHRTWTFARAGSADLSGHLARYGTVFIAAVLVGLGLLSLQVEVLGAPAVLAQAIAIVLVAPASFVTQRRWVFT